ncbi:MAG TPA: hypothetical protein VH137_05425 [Gemmatimonadales bacterium]|nr:hypothetical protein [Gemmatimonadales bacterium]
MQYPLQPLGPGLAQAVPGLQAPPGTHPAGFVEGQGNSRTHWWFFKMYVPPTLLPSGQMRATSGTASAEQSGSPEPLETELPAPAPLAPAVELPLLSEPEDPIEPDEPLPDDPSEPEEPPPVPGSTLPMQPIARRGPRANEVTKNDERTAVRMVASIAR